MEEGTKRKVERMRKPFQGIWTVISFNWHFFVLAFGLAILLLIVANGLGSLSTVAHVIAVLILATTSISLLVTFYVYDASELYSLNWLNELDEIPKTIVNIHAGFDETSQLIQQHFGTTQLQTFDFYDPKKHTEVSIKRARKVSTPFPGTTSISTAKIPLNDITIDLVIVFMSAHEIRNDKERIGFFAELNRITKPNGKVVVVEHLRSTMNFIAYTIGFFHFHTRKTWLNTFEKAHFSVHSEKNLTPFVTIFSLSKNGTAS